MTADLPDPHGCHVCGSPRFASHNGVVRCASCNWARDSAEPGCPVRNAVAADCDPFPVYDIGIPDPLDWPTLTAAPLASVPSSVVLDSLRESIAEETARERKVHGGGPRVNP